MPKRTPKKRASRTLSGMALIRGQRGLSAKIAKALEISRQAVGDWREVPIAYLDTVEKISGYDRERLRPDIFRRRRR